MITIELRTVGSLLFLYINKACQRRCWTLSEKHVARNIVAKMVESDYKAHVEHARSRRLPLVSFKQFAQLSSAGVFDRGDIL